MSERAGARRRSAVDLAFAVLASLLVVWMLAAALHDVSQGWDVWYYHLPFAARLVGLVPESAFVFHATDRALYAGLPLLGELLQGILWRASGRPESANLVAFASVPLFAWFLRRRYGVPWTLTVLALLAVPLIHVHATAAYVDLPANAAASVLVLIAIEALASGAPPSRRTLALALFTAGVVVNTKFQLHPVVLLALGAIAVRALPPLMRGLRGPERSALLRTLTAILLVCPLVFASPLKNLLVHHNPYYPVRLTLLGHTLPGTEEPYASSPPWLEHAPRSVRFAVSLFEIGIRPLSDGRRWTVDQWMPDDSTGSRMGGFFGAYVVVSLALFVWRVARDRSREARVAGISFAVLTVFASVMPQSHELRYYLYWMVVLLALNLRLACRPGATPLFVTPRLLGLVAVAALAVVLWVTRGGYAYPSGSSFAELLRARVDERALEGVQDGERICVRRAPFNVLWASAFHGPRRYVVKEAKEPDECAGYRLIE